LKKPLALEKAWSGRNNTAAEEDRTKARAGICSDAEGENQRQPQKQIQMNNTQKGKIGHPDLGGKKKTEQHKQNAKMILSLKSNKITPNSRRSLSYISYLIIRNKK
jgi:hypothetical protein